MSSPPPFPLSDHCDGHRFFNPRFHENRTFREILRWKRTSVVARWPRWVELPPVHFDPAPPAQGISATWINHASFLLRTPSLNLLLDPVFVKRLGPVSWAGHPRVHAPGLALENLPRIDVLLLSHDHYDHFCLRTLRRIVALGHNPLVITPLGNAPLARRAGLTRIIELDWWQTHAVETPTPSAQPATPNSPLNITLTPARHWSNRLTGRRNARLWGGFHLSLPATSLAAPSRKIYYSGDTGYDSEMFHDIRKKLGAPELALLPIGAYEPRWFMAAQHCNPAEAVQIHHDLGARRSIGMHWGCWQLTDEAREAPLEALATARKTADLAPEEFFTLQPGETMSLA